jgi:hypothetical protein
MSIRLNRRSFLQSLIALGASYVLPADATPSQVERVWEEAIAHPWHFTVNNWGTIADPDFTENENWGDIFCIATSHLKSPVDVINAVDRFQPLIDHFQSLATRELEALSEELDTDPSPRLLRQRHIREIIQAIEANPDYGWQDWVEMEGKAGVQRFKDEIDEWLDEPVDYSQSEWFPINHGSQGQAKAFFEDMDHETLKALRVVIIEGEHPGSTYYAAELRQSIEDANTVAEELRLPFRFKSENA